MSSQKIDKEFDAIRTCLSVLEPLEPTQRDFVLQMISSRLGLIALPKAGGSLGGAGGAVSTSGLPQSVDVKTMTPKEFLKAKRPTTDVERLTVLAYFLSQNRAQAHFKTHDLTTLNTEASGGRFSNAAFTASNAVKQNRYLAPAGGGKKQITALGEDVVNALPDREAVAKILADSRKRKGRSGRPKSKKKGK